jgi:uncharacterized RDD family membrane protein YckC
MSDAPQTQPPGWYYAQGDPPGTQRYWDGSSWQGGPQPVPGAAMAASDTPGGKLAEPVKRIVARIIDGVIWAIVSIVMSVIFGAGLTTTDASFAAALAASVIGSLLVVAYEVGMIGSQGGTLGKLALGIKVVNDDGSPADYMTGLRRMYLYLAFIIIGLIPILGGLAFLAVTIAGLVMLFTDAKQQTPWDKIGKTLVVER